MIIPKCSISAGNGVYIDAGTIYQGPGCSIHGDNLVDITFDYAFNEGSITAGEQLPSNPNPNPIFDLTFEEFEEYVFEDYLNSDFNWNSLVSDSESQPVLEPVLEPILASHASTAKAKLFSCLMALMFSHLF